MRRLIALFVLAVSWPLSVSAQEAEPAEPADSGERTANNVLYVELAGNGGIYSVNYERFVTDEIDIRLGLDFISLSASAGGDSANATVIFVPLMLNYMGIGSPDHKLELGIGPLLLYASAGISGFSGSADAEGIFLGGTATIGYRYIPHDGGFMFKVGFTPIFGQGGFAPWGGLGLGAVF